MHIQEKGLHMFSSLFPSFPFAEVNPLALIGGLLLYSYAAGRIAVHLNMPRVSGYLVAGMLASPSALGFLTEHWLKHNLDLITELALAVIAFLIGSSLRVSKLKKLSGQIFWITIMQGLGAMAIVAVVVYLTLVFSASQLSPQLALAYALMVGAMSAATAPAATLAIVHENRASGELTNTLFGVVALDDALAIILFTFAGAISISLLQQDPSFNLQSIALPIFNILGAVVLGVIFAWFLKLTIQRSAHHKAVFALVLGAILFCAGMAESLGFSPLLADMTLGMVAINRIHHHADMLNTLTRIEEPLFGLFFTLAGAHLNLAMVQTAGLLGGLVMAGRFLGKLSGTWLGGQISGASPIIKKYLGLALLPKAGVTIGLALILVDVFGPSPATDLVLNAILSSVVLNELIAPFFLRYALLKAGETGRQPQTGDPDEGE